MAKFHLDLSNFSPLKAKSDDKSLPTKAAVAAAGTAGAVAAAGLTVAAAEVSSVFGINRMQM